MLQTKKATLIYISRVSLRSSENVDTPRDENAHTLGTSLDAIGNTHTLSRSLAIFRSLQEKKKFAQFKTGPFHGSMGFFVTFLHLYTYITFFTRNL